MSATFLDAEEVAELTGRRMKSLQIRTLRQMGIPFHINATGHPVVCRSSVEGGKAEKDSGKWVPRVVRA